jgi:hypothetical protein
MVMSKARIYQPAKTAMQSGRNKMKKWVLDFARSSRVGPEPLMGWQSSADTMLQVKLYFDSADDAVAYAEKHALDYVVNTPQKRSPKPKAYADNFAYDRSGSWTH